jgi:hypothetical protein
MGDTEPAPLPFDRSFVILWTLLLIALALAPVAHGYAVATEDTTFSGFVGAYQNDYSSYLAWMRQAEDGHVLFRDLYTSEPYRRVFFHPLFWLMGSAARWTRLPLTAVWVVVQVAGCGLLVFGLRRLCDRLAPDRASARLMVVLATTASGFGWLMSAAPPGDRAGFLEFPIDLWMPEANAFQALVTSFFTLPLALGLMTWALALGLAFIDHGKWRDGIGFGLLALGLVSTHPYDLVAVGVVLGVWSLLLRPVHRGLRWMPLFIPLPYALYGLWVVRFDPVFSRVDWSMPRPSVLAMAAGWGLPLLLALGALVDPSLRRSWSAFRLVVAWLLAQGVLLAAPVGFQRKFVWGLHVPLCLLASAAAVHWIRAGTSGLGPRLRRAAIGAGAACLVLACSPGSVVFYSHLFERNRRRLFGDYLPRQTLEGLRWIEQNAGPDDVVLASSRIAPLIPGHTGRAVFEGHWAQTIDSSSKRAFVDAMFTRGAVVELSEVRRVFDRNRIRYVVLDALSAGRFGLGQAGPEPAFAPLVVPTFRNERIAIWEYRRDRPGVPPAWGDGDWRGAPTGHSELPAAPRGSTR